MGRFPGVVHDQETINPHDLCYQCFKYGPYFLFGKLRIKDFRNEPHFPGKINHYQVKSK